MFLEELMPMNPNCVTRGIYVPNYNTKSDHGFADIASFPTLSSSVICSLRGKSAEPEYTEQPVNRSHSIRVCQLSSPRKSRGHCEEYYRGHREKTLYMS